MDQHGDAYPLKEISVLTPVINAGHDPLTKYENAQALVARIPRAELVTIPKGGHLLLGSEERARLEIARFIQAIGAQ